MPKLMADKIKGSTVMTITPHSYVVTKTNIHKNIQYISKQCICNKNH